MDLTLVRVASSEAGTFGVLVADCVPFAVTLELPYRGNAPDTSCIPAGRYVCRRVRSPKFGETFEVTDVPGRTGILFHRGNQLPDTHGCILVAEEFADFQGGPGVARSAQGFDELMQRLAGAASVELTILTTPVQTWRVTTTL